MGDNYIKWLSNLSKDDASIAGGKGANLGEMFNSDFPVPPAFVITTEAFYHFLKETKLEQQIKDIAHSIDVDNTDKLTERSKEIRDLIINAEMPEKLQSEIIEAYDNFNVDLSGMQDSPGALSILRSAREPIFVSVRSSATMEDSGDASFAGQQDTFINIKGNPELIEKVKECFASIFTARSFYYRKKKGYEELVGIAVIVQKMINSDKSGIIFSHHPVKNNDEILIESVFGQGEGIVSGKIKPDQYTVSRELEILGGEVADKKVAVVRTAGGQTKTITLTPEKSIERVLKTYEIKQLADYAIKLEEHYEKPQDIEFAIENEDFYILQTRPITTLKEESKEEESEIDGQLITQGMAASPGVASGVVKIIHSMDDLNKIKNGDILVTKMTNPDMVVTMQKAAAILTSEGGITAHAAIVSREMGIPAIVGAQDALDVLKDGDEITIDGFHGKVFSGVAENKSVEILPIVETKTRIKVLVDLPQFAERAAKTKADGVGLVRLESLIATAGKHPLSYKEEGKLDEYKNMLKKGLGEIAETFPGKPIWIRSSDIRSDEYSNLIGAPKEIEKNPMLGNHGIRFSLKHPEIFKAELSAIKELADKGHQLGVMFPGVISTDEVKRAKKIMDELGIDNIKVGITVETPAAAILIKDICQEGIDFISFGTNDLTQYTLAIDRGNEDVQYIYNEMNWAVLKQMSRVIRECRSQGVETSICGQAGSKPEMVEYLVKQGIDSISVNADVAKEISELIHKLETGENKQIEKIGNIDSVKEKIKIEEKTLKVDTIIEEGSEMGESGATVPTDTSDPGHKTEPKNGPEEDAVLNPQNPEEEPRIKHNQELENPDEAPKDDKPRKEDIFN